MIHHYTEDQYVLRAPSHFISLIGWTWYELAMCDSTLVRLKSWVEQFSKAASMCNRKWTPYTHTLNPDLWLMSNIKRLSNQHFICFLTRTEQSKAKKSREASTGLQPRYIGPNCSSTYRTLKTVSCIILYAYIIYLNMYGTHWLTWTIEYWVTKDSFTQSGLIWHPRAYHLHLIKRLLDTVIIPHVHIGSLVQLRCKSTVSPCTFTWS